MIIGVEGNSCNLFLSFIIGKIDLSTFLKVKFLITTFFGFIKSFTLNFF